MNHEIYMRRCLQLAEKGRGKVMPNPMVGAVIVYKDEIIGEGYHEEFGKAHAEVNAIKSVKDKSLLKDSVIYVNLEPCAHHGKTPPCAKLLGKYHFKSVIISQLDPHKKVAGKGMKMLMDAGINVRTGVLEKQSKALNKRFNIFHKYRRPYIILKWAETKDGYIGRLSNDRSNPWITSQKSKKWVHELRASEAAILVGKNTANIDNPELNVRLVDGQNPLRIVLDRRNELNSDLKVFNKEAETIRLVEGELISNWDNVWEELFQILFLKGIQSLVIEGGKETLEGVIKKGYWDEAYKFMGDDQWEDGIQAPEIHTDWRRVQGDFDGDILYKTTK